MIGFSGARNDMVGPGDYEIATKPVVNKSSSGIIQWRKPTNHSESIKAI